MIGEERNSECEQMLRACAGLRLWRNAGGPGQSPLWILKGFSTQFLAPHKPSRSSMITVSFILFEAMSNRYHKNLHVTV